MDLSDKIAIDFSKPQRQSGVGIFIEMAYAFQKTIKAFWPLLLLFALRIKDIGLLYSLLVLLSVLILIIIFGYLNYRNFLFHINEEQNEFVLERGVVNKKMIVLDFSKIQQVNINQSFIQRLFNVYEVEIETAGSTKSEAKIKAVSKPVAQYLREHLFTERKTLENEAFSTVSRVYQTAEANSKPFVKISPGSLVKIAISSDYFKSLGIIAAFVFALFDKVNDILFKDNNEKEFLNYLYSLDVSHSLLLLVGAIIAFVFVFNLVRVIIIYFGFTIRKEGKSLQLSYGLFNTRNTIIQPAKVQIAKVVSNYFQRRMKLRRLFIYQASSNIKRDNKATIYVPGCSDLESENILQLLFNQQPEKGFMLKPDIRRVLSSVYKFILLPVILFIVFTGVRGNWMAFWIILPIYLLLVSLLIYKSFQNNRLYIHENFIIKQSGVWDIDTEILPPFKIQAISTRQNFWHVKSNIGHLVLHTAGGNITFKFGNFTLINKFTNYWLYQVQISEKEWM